ncbi:MAG TPA: hypothetical protein VMS11_13435, partial [Solirubrobacterales bacterium]|nr:hypothetical protein [Solirubrobacterales bacterium]
MSLPAIVRPAFTMGGQGGGVGEAETELRQVVSEGLAASPINQVLVEESVIGWGEFELEVMRDRNDNVVIICSIENVDPMGVHTGDSVTVAPAQTLTDPLYQELRALAAHGIESSPIGQVLLDQSVLGWGEFELEVMRDGADNVVIVCSIENVDPMGVHTGDSVTVAPQQTLTDQLYQRVRDQALTVIRAVGVETGGSNVQFAVNPETEEILVIEMNPRVSRSSALASK